MSGLRQGGGPSGQWAPCFGGARATARIQPAEKYFHGACNKCHVRPTNDQHQVSAWPVGHLPAPPIPTGEMIMKKTTSGLTSALATSLARSGAAPAGDNPVSAQALEGGVVGGRLGRGGVADRL